MGWAGTAATLAGLSGSQDRRQVCFAVQPSGCPDDGDLVAGVIEERLSARPRPAPARHRSPVTWPTGPASPLTEEQVFTAMLDGWRAQQIALRPATPPFASGAGSSHLMRASLNSQATAAVGQVIVPDTAAG